MGLKDMSALKTTGPGEGLGGRRYIIKFIFVYLRNHVIQSSRGWWSLFVFGLRAMDG